MNEEEDSTEFFFDQRAEKWAGGDRSQEKDIFKQDNINEYVRSPARIIRGREDD